MLKRTDEGRKNGDDKEIKKLELFEEGRKNGVGVDTEIQMQKRTDEGKKE